MRKMGFIGLLAVLCIAGAAFAQDTPPVFCGDLEQADCDLLRNSQAAMESLDSVAFDLTVNTTITNIPDMDEPVVVTLMGNGAFTGLANLRGNAALMQTDPASYLTTVLSGFDADLSFTLSIPPELAEDLDMGTLNSITLQARLVDGVGYLNTDTLQPFINNPSTEGWYGLDLAGLFEGLLEQNPDLFANMGAMSMFGMDMDSMAMAQQQFSDPAFISQFATIERVDIGMPDETTFRTTVNFGMFMSSPAFQDMMRQQMQVQMQMQGMMMSDEEMQQAMALSAQMFQNMTFTIDQTIGNTDFFVRSIHGTFALDTAAMMAAIAEMDSESDSTMNVDEPAPNISVDFTLFYNSYNSVPAIIAPEDATIIPWQMLLGFMEPTITPTFPTATTAAPQPTEEPTSEATVEPTSEVTVEPTVEVTAEPTSEVTIEPPPDVTVEPTVEVTVQS
jgi:hypothetical protein